MKTETYRRELLTALRLRDVPGPRIAEVLAELDSHLNESGEDPVEAFGAPRHYADRVLATLRDDEGKGWRVEAVAGSLVVAVAAGSGGYLLASGLIALAAGQPGVLGMSALLTTLVGLMLLGGVAFWQSTPARRRRQQILDPRTGADMTPPIPRWAKFTIIAVPGTLLVLGVLAGLLQR